ncbi:hypothetical protein [Hyphomicrobium sp.]|uniref:hypothetical protein n=1 Tax=Hyphomicrobium sp. TaxID=82 RepID=UPI000FAE9B7D|nr:hypothetical protein [Hyphomicrobium sp.]RUO97856.1 MAG: hypothetical protein EKK30_14055 [Hyphomicrobium sp.]
MFANQAAREPTFFASMARTVQRNGLKISAVLFLAALVFFVIFEWSAFVRAHLWLDEYFALWAGDPRLPFSKVFYERMLPDTNAPTYFALIYLSQVLTPNEKAAILWLNGIGCVAFLGLLLWISWKKRNLEMGFLAATFFLITAPALSFAIEGRVYFFSMLLTLNAAFLVASCIDEQEVTSRDIVLAAILGALSSWLHVFAALFCGALGAAMIVVGLFIAKRNDFIKFGFVMGGSAVVSFAIWIAFAYPMFSSTVTKGFWLVLDRELITSTLWGVKQFSVGFTWAAPLGALFVAISLLPRATRALATAVIVTGAIFFAVPFILSLRIVILQDRYFLIGIPALMILTLFLLREHLAAVFAENAGRTTYAAAALGGAFLLAPIVTGPPSAWWHFGSRWDWRGIDVVEPLISSCKEGNVRVLTGGSLTAPDYPARLSGFDYLLKNRLSFSDADKEPTRDVADIQCPVYGWAEHYVRHGDRDWVVNANTQDVLNEFHLTNTSNVPLTIERHPGGLVLRRAGS